MAKKNIDFVHWLSIENSFKNGSCVPFLGPGVNAPYEGYEGFRPSNEIALTLLKELINLPQDEIDSLNEKELTFHEALQPYKDLTRLGINDLARVALRYQSKGGQGLLIQRLRQLRNDETQEPSRLLNLIARHPFKLIATANLDRLMEKALNNNCKVVPLPDIEQGAISQSSLRDSLSTYYNQGKGPILYKFCGSYANGSGLPIPTQVSENDDSQLALQQRNHLFENMLRFIGLSDFQNLAFELGVNFQDIAGDTREAKIREFIIKYEQLRQIPELIEKLSEIQPQTKWDILAERQDQLVGASDSGRVVVSEEDFFGILTNAGNEEARPLIQQLQSYLKRGELFLFLGFRLESWEFRIMFKTLVENLGTAVPNRILIAIQKEPSDFWVEFWTKKGVECYDVDPAVFARQLEQRLGNG